jgi:hypothetical protein
MPFKRTFFNSDAVTTLTVYVDASVPDSNIYVATRPVRVVSVSEVHTVAGSHGSDVTLHVRKCTGTQTPAQGAAVHSGSFNMKGTANTVQTLAVNPANASLKAGDRLAIDLTGVPTAIAGGVVTITLV